MKDLYVVNCCRTAVGSFGGSLKNTPAADLGAIVVKEALSRAGVKPEQVVWARTLLARLASRLACPFPFPLTPSTWSAAPA